MYYDLRYYPCSNVYDLGNRVLTANFVNSPEINIAFSFIAPTVPITQDDLRTYTGQEEIFNMFSEYRIAQPGLIQNFRNKVDSVKGLNADYRITFSSGSHYEVRDENDNLLPKGVGIDFNNIKYTLEGDTSVKLPFKINIVDISSKSDIDIRLTRSAHRFTSEIGFSQFNRSFGEFTSSSGTLILKIATG